MAGQQVPDRALVTVGDVGGGGVLAHVVFDVDDGDERVGRIGEAEAAVPGDIDVVGGCGGGEGGRQHGECGSGDRGEGGADGEHVFLRAGVVGHPLYARAGARS